MAEGEKVRDIDSLKRFYPLDELDADRLAELARSALTYRLNKGQSISILAGKDQTVYLLAGEVIRSPGAADAERIKAGTIRACQPLITPEQRNRVVADTDVTIVCVDAERLEFLRNSGGVSGLVVDEIETGGSKEWVDSLLHSGVVLNLSPSSIQALMSAVESVEYVAGQVIFRQGEQSNYYFIISRGKCLVSRHRDGVVEDQILARLGPGDAFGEESLIANSTHGATVTMEESGLLLRLDRNNFKKLLEQPLVHGVGFEAAEGLKAKGAVLLDVRPAREFARDGQGLNIPFTELREQIHTLARDKHYIVVSDDNRTSAVAAFLLGQKQLQVSMLQTATREEAAAKAAATSPQLRELQGLVAQLQQELDQTRQSFASEQQSHISSRERLETLENELRQTQKEARSAIVEASVLKNKSEAMLRSRISELGTSLEQEQQQHATVTDEVERLQSELAAAQQQVLQLSATTQARGQEEAELHSQLGQLQQTYEQLEAERQALGQQLQEREAHGEHVGQALTGLQQQLNDASARAEQAEKERQALEQQLQAREARGGEAAQELAGLQQQLSETGARAEQAEKERQALEQQLQGQEAHVEQTAQELAGLRQQLSETGVHAEQLEAERQALEQQLQEHEAGAERTAQELAGLQQRLNETGVRAERAVEKLETRQVELQGGLAQAKDERQALQIKLNEMSGSLDWQGKELTATQQHLAEVEGLRGGLQQQLETMRLESDQQRHQLEEALGNLQVRHDGLERELAEEREEIGTLNGLLEETRQQLKQRGKELTEANGALQRTTQRAERGESELLRFQKEYEELESNLRESQQATQQTLQQVHVLEQERSELQHRLERDARAANKQAEVAARDRDALEEKLALLKKQMAEKEAEFNKAEAEYKTTQSQLERALKQSQSETRNVLEGVEKEKLRNNLLGAELVQLRYEKKRSGLRARLLLLLILLLVIALGVAYYLGVDVQKQAFSLVEAVLLQINRLIDTIPTP